MSLGVAYVPQGRGAFGELTVLENLTLSSGLRPGERLRSESADRVFQIFPSLHSLLSRRASELSRGQRQMLSLASGVVSSPRLLLVDEPSLGLSAPIVATAFEQLAQLTREFGTAILIIEQRVRQVLKVADRVYVMKNGQVSFYGRAAEIADEAALRAVYL